MSLVPDVLRAKAEVYYGDEACRLKSRTMLEELGLPGGLMPLRDMTECGYVQETGFLWLKQKRKVDHWFDKIGRKVSFAAEITAMVDKPNSRIKKLTGVRARELMVWMAVDEVFPAEAPPAKKIHFKTQVGLVRTFPASAFAVEEDPEDAAAMAVPPEAD